MNWTLKYIKEAENDLEKLDNSQRVPVLKGIFKALSNPLPINEGGYGHPLGNKGGNNLTGYLNLKFLRLGLRVVYRLEMNDHVMRIIAVSERDDSVVYDEVANRIKKKQH
jgi:mRNA interferase RelE/StbE